MPSENIIAQVNLNAGTVPHVFELAETPKGLIEARIDGDRLTLNEVKEMSVWLRMLTEVPDTRDYDG